MAHASRPTRRLNISRPIKKGAPRRSTAEHRFRNDHKQKALARQHRRGQEQRIKRRPDTHRRSTKAMPARQSLGQAVKQKVAICPKILLSECDAHGDPHGKRRREQRPQQRRASLVFDAVVNGHCEALPDICGCDAKSQAFPIPESVCANGSPKKGESATTRRLPRASIHRRNAVTSPPTLARASR